MANKPLTEPIVTWMRLQSADKHGPEAKAIFDLASDWLQLQRHIAELEATPKEAECGCRLEREPIGPTAEGGVRVYLVACPAHDTEALERQLAAAREALRIETAKHQNSVIDLANEVGRLRGLMAGVSNQIVELSEKVRVAREGIENLPALIDTAHLPDSFDWGEDAMAAFKFGVSRAAELAEKWKRDTLNALNSKGE